MMRILALLCTALLINGCIDLPGEQGDPCNKHGLCSTGFACNRDNICVKTSTTCASDSTGLCYDSNYPCGWFVGPYDASPAAEMCKVEPGTYLIGETKTPVDIPNAFYVDRFEVTNERYKAFISSLGEIERGRNLPVCSPGDKSWNASTPYYPAELADHPVVCVNRVQASAFCEWADKHLPDGESWEAAARGDDGRTYPWGEEDPSGLANCQENFGMEGYCNDRYPVDTCENAEERTLCADTAPIYGPEGEATLADGASPPGNLHMAGNVWEWVSDNVGANGIIRGGSWADYFEEMQTWSYREVPPDSYQKTTVGFRCSY